MPAEARGASEAGSVGSQASAVGGDLANDAARLIASQLAGAGRACITCSFQSEDVAVLHMLLQVNPRIPVLFLDTVHHFAQTYAYRDKLAALWNLNIVNLRAAEPATRLSWEIHEERTGLTAVTVSHECPGAPHTAALAAGQAAGLGGWSWVLSDLKTLLETGRPLTVSQSRGEDKWHTLS